MYILNLILLVWFVICMLLIIHELNSGSCDETFENKYDQNEIETKTVFDPEKDTVFDPYNDLIYNKRYNSDYEPNIGTQPESVIFDDVTQTIMTGSKFLKDTNLIPPPWVGPAWNISMEEPDVDADDVWKTLDQLRDDPRMIYNRCSLSCCANQWPTSMNDEEDALTRIKKEKGEYMTSNYLCSNSVGRTGCLCISKNQATG